MDSENKSEGTNFLKRHTLCYICLASCLASFLSYNASIWFNFCVTCSLAKRRQHLVLINCASSECSDELGYSHPLIDAFHCSGGLRLLIRDLNQYKIVVLLFGAAYAAPNIGHNNFIIIFQ